MEKNQLTITTKIERTILELLCENIPEIIAHQYIIDSKEIIEYSNEFPNTKFQEIASLNGEVKSLMECNYRNGVKRIEFIKKISVPNDNHYIKLILLVDNKNDPLIELVSNTRQQNMAECFIKEDKNRTLFPKDIEITTTELLINGKRKVFCEEYRNLWNGYPFLEKYSSNYFLQVEQLALVTASNEEKKVKEESLLHLLLEETKHGSNLEITYHNGYPIYVQLSGNKALESIGMHANHGRDIQKILTLIHYQMNQIREEVHQSLPKSNNTIQIRKKVVPKYLNKETKKIG